VVVERIASRRALPKAAIEGARLVPTWGWRRKTQTGQGVAPPGAAL